MHDRLSVGGNHFRLQSIIWWSESSGQIGEDLDATALREQQEGLSRKGSNKSDFSFLAGQISHLSSSDLREAAIVWVVVAATASGAVGLLGS